VVEPVKLNTFKHKPVETGDALDIPFESNKGKSPEGIAGNGQSMQIAKTPREIGNDDFAINKSHPNNYKEKCALIERGAIETLQQLCAMNEKAYPDDFNLEKVLVLLHKAIEAFTKGQTEVFVGMMKLVEDELKKMSEERQEELKKIQDRMSHEKWFQMLSVGGIVAGGIVGAIAATGGTATAAIAVGAALLGLRQVDKMLDNPMKNFALYFTPAPLMTVNEFLLDTAGMVLFGMNPTASAVAGVANAVSQIGTTYNKYKNTLTEADLERLKNQAVLGTDKLEDMGTETGALYKRYQSQTALNQQMLKHRPKLFI